MKNIITDTEYITPIKGAKVEAGGRGDWYHGSRRGNAFKRIRLYIMGLIDFYTYREGEED